MEELWLARHGETEWSRARRHTGTTDIPLTSIGIDQARALGARLRGVEFQLVLCSPLQRARMTAQAAGYTDVDISEDLAELRYGQYEGLTTPEITKERPRWNLWRDGCPEGETADDVGGRVDRVLERVLPLEGRVLAIGHGHTSRILAARFLGLHGGAGGLFAFDEAALGVLGYEHGRTVLRCWNETARDSASGSNDSGCDET
jgi:broad specificity phosphatase PhoE